MAVGRSNRLRSTPWLIAALSFALLARGLIAAAPDSQSRRGDHMLNSSSAEAFFSSAEAYIGPGSIGETEAATSDLSPDADGRYPSVINRPTGPPTITLTTTDPQGRTGQIACSTCHSVREPNFKNHKPEDLDEFHQNMTYSHGNLTCYACHNPDDADTLRLADTTKVDYADVMTLCSQCHGQQARDYEHGAHGGMNGYWDLTRGPRLRNNCIDCHDPHVPQYPKMRPTFKPRDRFLEPPREDVGHHGGVHSLQPTGSHSTHSADPPESTDPPASGGTQ